MSEAFINFLTDDIQYSPSDAIVISLHKYVPNNLFNRIVIDDKDLDNIEQFFEYIVELKYDITKIYLKLRCNYNKFYHAIKNYFGIEKAVSFFETEYNIQINSILELAVINNASITWNIEEIIETYNINFEDFVLSSIRYSEYIVIQDNIEHVVGLLYIYPELEKTNLYYIINKTGVYDLTILKKLITYSVSCLITSDILVTALTYKIYDPKKYTYITELSKKIKIPDVLYDELLPYSDNEYINATQLKQYLNAICTNNTLIYYEGTNFPSHSEYSICNTYGELQIINYFEDNNYLYFTFEQTEYVVNKCSLVGFLLNDIKTHNYFPEILLTQLLNNIENIKLIVQEKYLNSIENIRIYNAHMNLENYNFESVTLLSKVKRWSGTLSTLEDIEKILNTLEPTPCYIKSFIETFYFSNTFDFDQYLEIISKAGWFEIGNFMLTLDILNDDRILPELSHDNEVHLRKLYIEDKKSYFNKLNK